MTGRKLTTRAPAKVNLHLTVTGRRPDGYHLIETLMVKLDLSDRVEIVLRDGGLRLRLRRADLPADEGNLAFRAAQAFFRAAGRPAGAWITLEKNIPVAAGLGGGSSDAAAVLLGLEELHGRPLGLERLRSLGLTLGADVPFFLHPAAAAWATGIGEELRPGPNLLKTWLLLVNPGWPLSTAEVYKNLKLKLTRDKRNHIVSGLNASSFTIAQVLHNDLETVVLPKYPEVEFIKQRLLEAGAEGALMSGSGPTVFGMFSTRPQMNRARRQMEGLGKGRWNLLPTFTPPAARKSRSGPVAGPAAKD
ncbi:MAG: 4-(cytidine 5'-diphospho)-2-C-methyl-D-erythritol kinase [Thermodesulfobacteriota bacterium]